MKRLAGILATLVIAIGFLTVPVLAADYAGLVKEGDDWYNQRSDLARAKMAVEKYREAVAADSGRAEAYWKLSRALYWVGDKTVDKDAKMSIHQEAMDMAQKAIELAPNAADGHYWLGVNMGLFASAKGVMKSLSMRDPIKKEMEAVIKVDPGYADGGAYRVLGRMYFRLPGLFGGDKEKSIENFKKALEYGPKSYLTHVYMAETYMELDKDDEAKAALETVINGNCLPRDMPSCDDWKESAKKLMAELEK